MRPGFCFKPGCTPRGSTAEIQMIIHVQTIAAPEPPKLDHPKQINLPFFYLTLCSTPRLDPLLKHNLPVQTSALTMNSRQQARSYHILCTSQGSPTSPEGLINRPWRMKRALYHDNYLKQIKRTATLSQLAYGGLQLKATKNAAQRTGPNRLEVHNEVHNWQPRLGPSSGSRRPTASNNTGHYDWC